MSQDERRAEMITRQILASAGWQPTERGAVFKTANLQYINNSVRLEVDINPLRPSLFFTVEDSSGRSVDLVIHYEEHLEKILETIVSFQADITESNYRHWLNELVNVSPAVYLDTGDEMIPLIGGDEFLKRNQDLKE